MSLSEVEVKELVTSKSDFFICDAGDWHVLQMENFSKYLG